MKYNPGDIVEFKSWDELYSEFGANQFGIKCQYMFTPDMTQFCGKRYEVLSSYGVVQIVLKGVGTKYRFSNDMVKLIKAAPKKKEYISDEDIKKMLLKIANIAGADELVDPLEKIYEKMKEIGEIQTKKID